MVASSWSLLSSRSASIVGLLTAALPAVRGDRTRDRHSDGSDAREPRRGSWGDQLADARCGDAIDLLDRGGALLVGVVPEPRGQRDRDVVRGEAADGDDERKPEASEVRRVV